MGLRRLAGKVRATAGSIRTQYEYERARQPFSDDVARSLPDADSGVYIRGPLTDWEESNQEEANNPVRPTFGRRKYDPDSGNMITKKLVVVTVILVNAFFLAGDALLTGPNFCP